MEIKNVSIVTARITGLESLPKCIGKKKYAWEIKFFDMSSAYEFDNSISIEVGDTEELARAFSNKFKGNLKQAGILEAQPVAVIFDDGGSVIAIGRTKEDVWIDINDKFAKKTFKDLNVIITSLKVY